MSAAPMPAHGGGTIAADELARVTASNLQDESADVVTTAEHAIALLCSLARKIPQATASMKAGRWEKG